MADRPALGLKLAADRLEIADQLSLLRVHARPLMDEAPVAYFAALGLCFYPVDRCRLQT
jgi:hypothetical protein